MTDNRTTERLRALLDERGVEYKTHDIIVGKAVTWTGSVCNWVALPDERGLAVGVYKDYLTPERAVAATLRMKAKSHPYGYEPDTGAFDATRCECGCINDISATYCNDCGGEIEINMNAEKEIYHTPAHMVFAEKHDDGSLEFAGKRYIAATLGSGNCARCAESMGRYADSLCDPLKERIAELLRCLENDWHIHASWDGLRKFWCVELTEEGVKLRDATHGTLTAEQVMAIAGKHQPDYCSDTHVCFDWQAIADELNATLGRWTCKPTEEDCCPICGEDLVKCNVGIGELGGAVELDPPIYHNYCPNCGAKVVER